MLVFDITTRSSFDHIKDWYREVESNVEDSVLYYLVGNFADCEQERKVERHEATTLCKELNFHNYVETSAYTGANISSLFVTLTKHLYVKNESNISEFVSTVFMCAYSFAVEIKR
jgi:GTPase SAR1 family protein